MGLPLIVFTRNWLSVACACQRQRHRQVVTALLLEATPEQRDTALGTVVHVVSGKPPQPGWRIDSDRAAVEGVGRFVDAHGTTFVDAATANLFMRTGRLRPVPASMGREADFVRVFGDQLPNAIPVETCSNREWVQVWKGGTR